MSLKDTTKDVRADLSLKLLVGTFCILLSGKQTHRGFLPELSEVGSRGSRKSGSCSTSHSCCRLRPHSSSCQKVKRDLICGCGHVRVRRNCAEWEKVRFRKLRSFFHCLKKGGALYSSGDTSFPSLSPFPSTLGQNLLPVIFGAR